VSGTLVFDLPADHGSIRYAPNLDGTSIGGWRFTASQSAPAAAPAAASAVSSTDLRQVEPGVYASSSTSTQFAEPVVSAWDGAPGVKSVYSPVTRQTYAMTYKIVGAGTVIATGGNGAYVQF
jgi:hypothetical protein